MYIGVDFGSKWVGFARGSSDNSMALPSRVVGRADALRVLKDLLEDAKSSKDKVEGVVIGASYAAPGKANPIMKLAYAYANDVMEKTGKTVFFADEFQSTAAVKALQTQYGGARRRQANPRVSGGNKDRKDAQAAAIILQRFLDVTDAQKLRMRYTRAV